MILNPSEPAYTGYDEHNNSAYDRIKNPEWDVIVTEQIFIMMVGLNHSDTSY